MTTPTATQVPAELRCTGHTAPTYTACEKVGSHRCAACGDWRCADHYDARHGTCPYPRHA